MRADRWLEWALLVGVVAHGVALVSGLGGAGRAFAVASDVAIAGAMSRATWVSRLAACVVLGAALAEAWEPRAIAVAILVWCVALPRGASIGARVSVWLLGAGACAPRHGAFFVPLFLLVLAEIVLHRARPFESYGRLARWRHPLRLARPLDAIANSRVCGMLFEPLPEVTMRSDITDVVYVNYLVPVAAAEALVPPGLELQRLGPNGKYALFTFLTYRHGHFGFAFLGPLRRLLPSPVQTNWRIHVRDPRTKHEGIYFLTNAITSTLPALAARMTTEGMPMHVLARGEVRRDEAGALTIALEPGRGTAPDAEIALRPAAAPPALTGSWAECWPDWRAFLAYCVPQDRAMSSQPLRGAHGRVSRQEIDLGIPLDACVPLEGTVRSRAARAIAGDAAPLCFYVPSVAFTFSVEAHDSRAEVG